MEVAFESVGQCAVGTFFDISSLLCTTCPPGSFPSRNQLTCVSCDATTGTFYDFKTGIALSQNWLPAAAQGSSSCACASAPSNASTVVSAAVATGAFVQRCVVCPTGTRATAGGLCAPGGLASSLPLTPTQQLQRVLTQLGIGMSTAAAQQAFINVPSTSNGDVELTLTIAQSEPMLNLLGPASYTCLQGKGADRASCNAVANLCALTLYDSTSGACRIYNGLVRNFVQQSSPPPPPFDDGTDTGGGDTGTGGRPGRSPPPPRATSPSTGGGKKGTPAKPDTGNMPWLFYTGNTYLFDSNVNLKFQFSNGDISQREVSRVRVLLGMYALNGTWLGWRVWTSEFQLCGAPKIDGSRWSKFGWNYKVKCNLRLWNVFSEMPGAELGYTDVIFYEPFLQTSDNTMYPIPVDNINKDQLDGNDDYTTGAVRRFFYLDARLGYNSQAGKLQAIQFPTNMYFVVTLRKEPRDRIYPPLLKITYGGWQVDVDSDNQVDFMSTAAYQERAVQYQVVYTNEQALRARFWYAWQTILIVYLVVCAFPAFILEMYRHMRKKREQADQDMLVHGFICICDYGSFWLVMVLLTVSLYYLIIIKLQEEVYFLMMEDYRLEYFRDTVIIAIVGQSVTVMYLIWKQIGTDVFFLDWEKPRKVINKDGTKEEPAPVSCWRMLMVANEWNELQTTRITHPAFTLLMLVMIMEGAGVINAAKITPDANDFHDYENTVDSMILRMGVEFAFFLVLFLGQYLWKKLIYYPYFSNPVTQFIDLMYLANISTFIFDDTHSGYYLHGRNQAQHSDTTLRQLNQELLKEEEGLTAQRGLITTTGNPKLNDNQLFVMFVTDSIRKTYEGKMLQQAAQAASDARNRKGMVSTYFRGMGRVRDNVLQAQEDIGTLFKQMIDDVERNHATQVIDPTFWQLFLGLPPENAANNPCFLHDYFNGFATTLWLGQEVRLFVFEAMLFCAIDMDLKCTPVTALIVYIIIRVLAYARGLLGEANVSEKTLVDRHFLI